MFIVKVTFWLFIVFMHFSFQSQVKLYTFWARLPHEVVFFSNQHTFLLMNCSTLQQWQLCSCTVFSFLWAGVSTTHYELFRFRTTWSVWHFTFDWLPDWIRVTCACSRFQSTWTWSLRNLLAACPLPLAGGWFTWCKTQCWCSGSGFTDACWVFSARQFRSVFHCFTCAVRRTWFWTLRKCPFNVWLTFALRYRPRPHSLHWSDVKRMSSLRSVPRSSRLTCSVLICFFSCVYSAWSFASNLI